MNNIAREIVDNVRLMDMLASMAKEENISPKKMFARMLLTQRASMARAKAKAKYDKTNN